MTEGIDADRVSGWLEANVPGATAPFEIELIAGGRSNLTYRVTSASGERFALRRPPTAQVLPTAHDMGREYRIISALGATPVPVPTALAFCGDPEITGAPFYVMGFVEGHILRNVEEAERLDRAARKRASFSLVDTLTALHSVDLARTGLDSLARHEGYIERQLKRWYGQFTTSQGFTGRRVPAVDAVHDILVSRIPEQGPATIVHGDFRLDNTVLGDDGTVIGVLDWEICTLGDPLADVGLLMVYWAEAGDPHLALDVAPTLAGGFATRAELADRYAAATGRNLGSLPFYVAFGYWKLACILEGVYSRYSAGAAAGDRTDHEIYAEQVGVLANLALETAATI